MRYTIRVTPNASRDKIVEDTQEDGSLLYRIAVTVPPEDGKANEAVIKLLAKHLGIAKSSLRIIRGETSRHKVVERIL